MNALPATTVVIPARTPDDPAVRTLTTAGDVVVGEFRCTPEERHFPTAGRITRHCFVFPRCGVWIQHEHRPAFVADPTRITLYNPQQPYERRALDPSGDRGDWITVSDEIARDAVARHDPAAAGSPDRVFQHAFAPADAELYLTRRCLHEYVRRQPQPDLLFVEETAVNLLTRTVAAAYGPGARRTGASTAARRHRDIVERVRAHLNETFSGNESLTSIARTAGVSVYHLCRIFQRGTGSTLHAYRHQLRLRHALEPLQRADADLLTIALDLGYTGHSHFGAAFRRQFGTPPSHVRERFHRC